MIKAQAASLIDHNHPSWAGLVGGQQEIGEKALFAQLLNLDSPAPSHNVYSPTQ